MIGGTNLKQKRKLHVASGYPDWINPELIAETIKTWQPYYSDRLTESDALAILPLFGRLISCLHHQEEHCK